MKKLILSVLSIQLFAQPNSRGNVAAIITKPSKENPSANGVHEINEGQLRRIVSRALGFYSPIGFKHIVDACNGAVKLSIDAVECKVGEAYKKANGETGTYTKDWTKYSNHEVSLGIVGSMKLAELSLSAGVQQATAMYSYAPAPRKEVVAEVEETTADANTTGEVIP